MMQRRLSHLVAVGASTLLVVFLVGACGSSESAGPVRSTIVLDTGSTAFQTIPPATVPPTTSLPVPGARVEVEQVYTVQSGDWPLRIADMFDVSLQDLVSYNGWVSEREFPLPGSVIKIPPGGITLADSAGDATPGAAIPDAGNNCQPGSYILESGDYPLSVAEKFDVTLEALTEANVNTDGYRFFAVGLTIVIPVRDDCDAAAGE